MNDSELLDAVETTMVAPKTVQQLRGMILRLAVQGRLAAQDPTESDAMQLVAAARTERRRLAARKVVRDEDWDQALIVSDCTDLPAGWIRAPLAMYVAVIMGQSPPSTAYNKTGVGIPFYQGKAQFGRLHPTPTDWCTEPTKLGEAGDVLISVRAPVGPTNLLTETACVGRGLAALRSLGGDQRYLLYALRAAEARIAAMGVGSTFTAISKHDLDTFMISIPPLAEQKRIVAKVDELMALCDRLEAQLKQRDEQAGVLAKAAVARFQADPTVENLEYLFHRDFAVQSTALRDSIVDLALRGKLVCPLPSNGVSASDCWRVGAVRSGAASDNASAPLKPEESPWRIPPSWTWLRLGTVANIKHGYAFSSVFFTTERTGHVLTTPGNFFESGGFRDRGAGTKYFRGEVPPEFVLRAGDLIVPMTEQAAGLLGSPAFVPDDGRTYLHNQRLGKLELYSDQVSLEYLFWFFNSRYFRGELARTCTGMKVRHTSPKRILSVLLALPPLAEQRRIVAKVNELMALVDQLESQITASEEAGTKLLDALVAELAPSN